jgi:hypothetical protein
MNKYPGIELMAIMSIVIKIDPASIKKNPNAFKTTSYVKNGPREIRFSYDKISKADFLQLKHLSDLHDDVILRSYNISHNGSYHSVSGLCLHEQALERLPKEDLSYEINDNVQVFEHYPEPEYLYNYLPTKVKCRNCKKMILHSAIANDCDDDGCCWTVCPNCSGIDTFEFEYQQIDDVISKP